MKQIKSSQAYILAGLQPSEYTESDIAHDVCRYFKISQEEMRSKSRYKECVIPRQVICFFIKEKFPKNKYGDMHDTLIAGIINRDRTSVIHSYKAVKKDIETNPVYRDMIKEINDFIEAQISSKQII